MSRALGALLDLRRGALRCNSPLAAPATDCLARVNVKILIASQLAKGDERYQTIGINFPNFFEQGYSPKIDVGRRERLAGELQVNVPIKTE
jgi:hypothetical protein